MRMLQAIPALPVRNILQSVDFYRDKLGFTIVHQEDGFAVIQCNEVKINLWAASDESWRVRNNLSPIVSGAESFIAGTASCRIEVDGVDELFRHIQPKGILHTNGTLSDQWWGERDFSVTDLDNNLITFFERLQSPHYGAQ